jgi:hypothetical protein
MRRTLEQLQAIDKDMCYFFKSDIIDLGNWIARQKTGLKYCTFNYYELIKEENQDTATIKISFEYRQSQTIELSFENIAKVRQILKVIKSNEYPRLDIYKKLLTQFRTK